MVTENIQLKNALCKFRKASIHYQNSVKLKSRLKWVNKMSDLLYSIECKIEEEILDLEANV